MCLSVCLCVCLPVPPYRDPELEALGVGVFADVDGTEGKPHLHDTNTGGMKEGVAQPGDTHTHACTCTVHAHVAWVLFQLTLLCCLALLDTSQLHKHVHVHEQSHTGTITCIVHYNERKNREERRKNHTLQNKINFTTTPAA